MEIRISNSQVAPVTTTTAIISNRRETAMFKTIAISAIAVAAFASVVISAGAVSARVGDPVMGTGAQGGAFKIELPTVGDAMLAFVLSTYPLPGDPMDAEASVANLLGVWDGDALGGHPFVAAVAAQVLRSMQLPYDDADARAVFADLYDQAMANYRPVKISEIEAPALSLTAAAVVPQPWDPQDATD